MTKQTETTRSIFNKDNQNWKKGNYATFLDQPMALYDSVNVTYPKMFDLYKLQKSKDWSEDEVALDKDRENFMTCSKNNYDIMIKTLSFQWELDSVASRAIAPLFSPFVTNSELWAMISKQSEVENLHSLCYSEIIRNAVSNPDEVFKEVMHNDEVTDRSTKVVEVFNNLAEAGAKYTLGKYKRDDYELKKIILLGVVALYCLEKIQFQSSFACTFVLADSGIFQGIGALVKLIAQDEAVHAQMDKEILRAMLQNEKHMGWKEILDENIDEVKEIIDEVVQQEFDWNKYLFSEGRSVVGLNETLLSEWVLWNAQEVYDFLEIENDHQRIKTNPLPWMDDWLDINRTQQANQESDNINYRLNSADNDLDDDEEIEL